MNALRTPDERFQNLPGYDFAPHYTEVIGLRMHYLDEGQGDPVLCLHGEPSWCYLYRKMIPTLAKNNRVIAPDLIGFGRSDKPTAREDYTYAMHHDALGRFIEALDLRRITLVCQDWGGLLGLPLAAEMPERFARLVMMNTGLPTGDPPQTPAAEASAAAFLAWRNFASSSDDMPISGVIRGACVTRPTPEVLAAYDAPFPDKSYKVGALMFPLLVPIAPTDAAAPVMKRTREALKQWTKPALAMFSDSDPITAGGDQFFRRLIPSASAEPEITIAGGGHFLQEDKGEELAEQIARFIERRPI
jgi:haloalkane dehalogenase